MRKKIYYPHWWGVGREARVKSFHSPSTPGGLFTVLLYYRIEIINTILDAEDVLSAGFNI